MGQLSELKTKTARVRFIKDRLTKSDRWVGRALLTIHRYQTEDEQRDRVTKEHNGVGFSGIDAELLTSFVVQIKQKGGDTDAYDMSRPFKLYRYLSPRQEAILKNKIGKYAKQLERLIPTN